MGIKIAYGLQNASNEELSATKLFSISESEVDKIFALYPFKHITPHNFRGLLNGLRDEKAKSNLNIRDTRAIKRDIKILSNHANGDVNTDHYLWTYQQPNNRVKLYNLYHPY